MAVISRAYSQDKIRKEGTARGHYTVDNVHEDSLMVSLLPSEYETLKGTWQKPVSQH